MKEIGNSIAQLAAIIMILITLAVSTAAVSQWANAETTAGPTETSVQTQTALVSDAR